MTNRCVVAVALALALTGCKGGNGGGAFEIKSDVKRDTKKMTGLPSEMIGSLKDAKPALSITGVTGPIADAMTREIETSPIAKQGAVAVDAKLVPASPGDSGTLDATLAVKGLFAHPPQISKLDGTLSVHLTYSNASGDLLGASLGEAVTSWLASEKLPANLGVPTGAVPKITSIVAGPPHCTLHEDGSVRCWDIDRDEAIVVPKAAPSIAIGSANNFGACGVREDGTAWCMDAWDNSSGFEIRSVCGVTGATAISVGQQTACALVGEGHVRCWPRDAPSYEPCTGTTASAEIEGVADAISVDTGPFDGCVVKKDGSVACWEHCGKDCKSGAQGRFDPRVPVKAAVTKGIAKAKQVVMVFQACAWVGDDHVVCAADGKDKASDVVVPEPIKKLVRERMGVCAVTTKGNLFCSRGGAAFTKVDGVSDVADAGGSNGGSCAVNSKNEVVCWGGMSGSDPVKPVSLGY